MHSIFGELSRSLSIAFLVSMSFALGTELNWGPVATSLRDKGLVWRALAANLIFVPLLGLALARVFSMPPDFMIAFLLLACAPGAAMSLSYTRKKDEDAPFAAGLTFLLLLAAACFTGPIAELILPIEAKVNVPVGRVAMALVFFMILPGLAGFVIQNLGDDHTFIRKVALLWARLLFFAWMLLVTAEQGRAVRQIGIRTLAPMVGLILGSMTIGWLLGGPKRDDRRILATGTSMRNIALCAVIAMENFSGTQVELGIVAFSALMVTPNSLLVMYENYRRRRAKRLTAVL